MKFSIALFVILFSSFIVQSQTYEIGGFLGGANYIGDIGKTTYIAPNTPVFGGLFRWNRSPRHSFRASLTFAKIQADDKDSKESRRIDRGYKFENNIMEASVGIEYTFWEFNMFSDKAPSAPYLYTGLTYFWYNALYNTPGNSAIVEYDNAGSVALPIILGYKVVVATKFVLSFEIGARYTFTDGLDGSNPVKDLEGNRDLQFGNINNNDWYMFTGLSLTYTFGRKPCYCNF
jgi:hypothetical protein